MAKEAVVFASCLPKEERSDWILIVNAVKQFNDLASCPDELALKLWDAVIPMPNVRY